MTVTELIDTSFSSRYWSYGATVIPAHLREPAQISSVNSSPHANTSLHLLLPAPARLRFEAAE